MISTIFLMIVFSDFTHYSQKPMPSSNPPNTPPRESQQASQPGQQIEASFKTSDGTEVLYLLYLPKNFRPTKKAKFDSNADLESRKKFALLYFLHGRGESHGPLNRVAKWGPPKMVAQGDHLPYIIVSPQCPADDWWATPKQQTRLTELLDHILASYPIDKEKIFLTGLSMGGYGSWAMAASQPNRFAAVIPICGGGNPAHAKKLTNLPIWAFHGTNDEAVPFQESATMVDAIKAAGGTKVRFTTLEHFGHNTWSAAYASPELFQWMEREAANRSPSPPE